MSTTSGSLKNHGKSGRPNRIADTIAGLDDPSMGDERETAVILRAYTVASVFGTYSMFVVAIVFALIGAGLWSSLIILATSVGNLAASRYAKHEGVDLNEALARTTGRRFTTTTIVGCVLALFWFAAFAVHFATGHPVFDVGLGRLPGADDSDTALGFVVGGVTGIAAVVLVMVLARRRRRIRTTSDPAAVPDEPDVD